MDETESHWKETGAGCLAILLLLAATIIFARCSQPANTEIEITLLKAELVESVGYDFSDNAARALADLDAYLITVTITTSPRSAAAPKADPAAPSPTGDRWDQLANCETGGNWAANTGNGFGGGLQFMHQRSYSTWLSFGGGEYAAHPWEASREQQIAVAEKVLASSGWNAWPGCSRKFGWL
jgi:hypothetical protein